MEWKGTTLCHIPSPRNRDLLGLTVTQAAEMRGAASPEDFVCQLLLKEELEVEFGGVPPEADVWEAMNQDLVQLLMRTDYTIGSDNIMMGERPNPRTYGCFPRLIGDLRRQYNIPLETVVNRASAAGAKRFGLTDRGVLQPGKAADIAIFDPDRLSALATYDDPRRLPLGMYHVLVNGQLAVQNGRPTGVLAGRALP